MKCPYCGLEVSRAARRCECGPVSPESRANRMRGRDLHGGYFYPLDRKRALDVLTAGDYLAACVKRALREKASARNRTATAARRLRERELSEQRERSDALELRLRRGR